METDGSNMRQLTSHSGDNEAPVVSPDGRTVVFASQMNGVSNVWRVDADGTHVQQLSRGNDDFSPEISPDRKWFFSLLDEPVQ